MIKCICDKCDTFFLSGFNLWQTFSRKDGVGHNNHKHTFLTWSKLPYLWTTSSPGSPHSSRSVAGSSVSPLVLPSRLWLITSRTCARSLSTGSVSACLSLYYASLNRGVQLIGRRVERRRGLLTVVTGDSDLFARWKNDFHENNNDTFVAWSLSMNRNLCNFANAKLKHYNNFLSSEIMMSYNMNTIYYS